MDILFYMTYSEKLKNPRWQKKRLEILDRDGFTCIGCNSDKKTLHVHHKVYKYNKDPWDYPNSCYQTLCEDCHLEEEAYKTKFKELSEWLLINYDLNYSSLLIHLEKLVIK